MLNNIMEGATGQDLDGDGDVGQFGHNNRNGIDRAEIMLGADLDGDGDIGMGGHNNAFGRTRMGYGMGRGYIPGQAMGGPMMPGAMVNPMYIPSQQPMMMNPVMYPNQTMMYPNQMYQQPIVGQPRMIGQPMQQPQMMGQPMQPMVGQPIPVGQPRLPVTGQSIPPKRVDPNSNAPPKYSDADALPKYDPPTYL